MGGIYSRAGDDGTSSLADGRRLPKGHPRFDLLGCLDEVNCLIGAAKHPVIKSEIVSYLDFLQHRLLNCGAMVADAQGSSVPRLTADDVAALERGIDRLADIGGGSTGFILPGADETSAPLHVARAAMRRTERAAARLAAIEDVDPTLLAFLNRASDLLYAAARAVSAGADIEWRPDLEAPSF